MKYIKHIGRTLLLLAVAFTSCDKLETEDMQSIPEMDIPAGYMKVTFPAEKTETRAVNGEDRRISHLRCLVYKEDENQTYRLFENDVLIEHKGGTTVTWPYTEYSINVPKNANYKVVFLGNVDKSLFEGQTDDLLSGIENNAAYEDASIIAPSAGFDESKYNLYYWAGCSFSTTPTDPDNSKMTVNATLQRIVSRCRLSSYGIEEGTTELGPQNNYSSWFYYSLLNDDGLLGEKVFGSTGKMGDSFLEMLKTDIIYPIAYMLKSRNSLNPNSTAGQWYNQVGGDSYEFGERWQESSSNIKSFLTNIAKNNSKLYTSNELNHFIDDLLDESDNKGYRKKMIAAVKASDVADLQNNNRRSYSYAKELAATMLQTAQSGNDEGKFLTTWENLQGGSYSMDITLDCKNVPQKLGLDLQVKENQETYTKTCTVTLSSASTSKNTENKYNDNMLNLYFLGNKEGKSTFGFTNLMINQDTPVNVLPEGGFSLGGTMEVNKSLDYRTKPTNIQLGDAVTDTKVKIYVIYGKLIDAIESELPSSLDKASVQTVFKHALGALSGLYSGEGQVRVELYDNFGRLTTNAGDNRNGQVGFDFAIPNFSPSNLTGELEWVQVN